MPSKNPLPPKENALFKRILKCYEQKQYKNGLKFSKQILTNPKFSEHGETLAMKGLILNCLGRKEEAYDHVKRGLTNDLQSQVCWHVYGLMQRSDKQYAKAISAYRNALRWDKDNIQILRDLSLLQIQMRDLDGYKETRHQLFQLRPTQRASWIGFAMSYHLLEDYEMALKILEEFRKTQKKPSYDYEYSELLLYQNMVIRESGDVEAALSHLELYHQSICDKINLKEIKGKYLLSLGRNEEAESLYVELLKRNPENHEYYKQLEVARNASSIEEKFAIYVEYQEKFPRAQAPKRLPLNFLIGAEFESKLTNYIKAALRKGVPPLFVDMRPLYSSPEKFQFIDKLFNSFLVNLQNVSSFEESGSPKESPTTLLWTYYYLAQHCDYKGEHQKALDHVNAAIEHTPTLIELFLLKGKIYKHAGDPEEAVKWLDEAQSMDTADRYINCKCAKYMLRANKVPEAEAMCGKFTREGVPPMENLNEMQCMWFQCECALAYQRMEQYGECLKKCSEIDRHFSEIIEDQFDFHTYCMRKMTLKAYVDLLRLENKLRSHKFYEKVAGVAIKTYLRLSDKPLAEMDKSNEKTADKMDPSELKKLKNKAKKAQRKAEQEKAMAEQDKKKKELHNKNKKKAEDELDTPAKDELVPEKLERPDDPLEEASKYLTPLITLSSDNINTHLLAFEIHFRRGRVLLMLRAIKQAIALDPDNLQLHGCLVRFLNFVEKNQDLPGVVQTVVKDSFPDALQGKTATQLNASFLAKYPNDLAAQFIGAKMMATLSEKDAEQAVQVATNLKPDLDSRNLDVCEEVLVSLKDGDFGSAGINASDSYRKACCDIFPIAKCFKDPTPSTQKEIIVKNHKNRDVEKTMEQLPAILQDTAAKISSITRKSDKFLSQDADLYEKSKLFTKVLYDITKLAESKPSKLTLPELIIEDFNPEQVWAGVELQNQDKFTKLESQFNSFHIKDLSQQPLLIGKPSLKNVGNEPLEEEFEYDLDDDVSDSENIVDDEEKLPDDPDVSDDADEKSEGSDDDILNDPDFQNMSDSDGDDLPLFQDLDENEIDSEADGDEEKKSQVERTSESKGRRTEIDDKFFKLSDMEKFHDMEDPSDILNSKKSEEDELVDMFGDIPDDDDANTMYKDYWVDADPDSAEIGNDSDADDQDESEDNIEMPDNNDVSGDDGGSEEVTKSKLLESSDEEEESVAKSSHEVANERLAKKINKMEEAAVGDKAWQMGGEVSAPVRPENSLLSEHLEYDSAAKQAPVITEEVSRKLEDIILQRIKDKAWDDVERKVKPVEDPFEYKKKLVLDQEKSKLSLAQIYEEEFMKVAEQSTEKKVSVGLLDKEQEETPEEVEEIKSMMNSLFRKLDSLSHLHFTPKQKSAELKVVRNIPTIAMEEVAPVAATNADLLAPAEVVDKKKGELVDDKEKTKTDRKREKREKKAKLKAKIKEKERKEKLVSKLNPGLGNKYSKEKALKQLEEAEKQGKVINLNKKKKDDSVKNSKSFFSNLQDEVKTHVREKGVEKKRKSKSNSMNAASLKL